MKNNIELSRLGQFIGDTRISKHVAIEKLAEGLCTTSYLNHTENGEREMDKLMTDTLLQRLGLFSERFRQILGVEEFEKWEKRQKISRCLSKGDTEGAGETINNYCCQSVLERQFIKTAEINISWLGGAAPDILLPMVEEAISYTRPRFKQEPLEKAIFSELEGCLILARLELREQTEGLDALVQEYLSLLKRLNEPYYDKRERAYLVPRLTCHAAEWYFNHENFAAALEVCRNACKLLSEVKRLSGYEELLRWEEKILGKMGSTDDMPTKLLEQLELLRPSDASQVRLLVPYEERGMVFCVNQVIKTRRLAFGISQEKLAEGVCDVRTLSRIENMKHSPQKKKRTELLRKLGMSGERYDYQIITERYEDYVRCIDYENLSNNGEDEKADKLFEILKKRTPDTLINRQYITAQETYRLGELKEISTEEEIERIKKALAMTFPFDVEKVDAWKVCVLSINEVYIILNLAAKYKKQRQFNKALPLLQYVMRSFELNGDNMYPYMDTYIRFIARIASYMGDMGNFEESDRLARECIELSFICDNTIMLAMCLRGLAWNVEHFIDTIPEKEIETRKKLMRNVHSLYRQAYAVAIVSDNLTSKRYVERHYKMMYGLNEIL